MKVYIAGKITGDKNYRRKFKRAEKRLRALGCSVMNPAWLGDYPEFSYEDYMTVSGSMQRVCDAVFFLSDWEDSPGARREMERAESLHQTVFFESRSISTYLLRYLQEKERNSKVKVG
jgi:hypothetical protein